MVMRTETPDGRTVRLPPPAVRTSWIEERGGALPFAPAYGEQTDAVLGEVGVELAELDRLREIPAAELVALVEPSPATHAIGKQLKAGDLGIARQKLLESM